MTRGHTIVKEGFGKKNTHYVLYQPSSLRFVFKPRALIVVLSIPTYQWFAYVEILRVNWSEENGMRIEGNIETQFWELKVFTSKTHVQVVDMVSFLDVNKPNFESGKTTRSTQLLVYSSTRLLDVPQLSISGFKIIDIRFSCHQEHYIFAGDWLGIWS